MLREKLRATFSGFANRKNKAAANHARHARTRDAASAHACSWRSANRACCEWRGFRVARARRGRGNLPARRCRCGRGRAGACRLAMRALISAPPGRRPGPCGPRARRNRRSSPAIVSGMPIIRSMPALTRPRINAPSHVTTGRSWASASSVVLPPDQPMLSSMTSHCALAAAKRFMSMLCRNTQ